MKDKELEQNKEIKKWELTNEWRLRDRESQIKNRELSQQLQIREEELKIERLRYDLDG